MANVNQVKRNPVYVDLDKQRQLKYTLNSFAEMEDRYGSVDDALKAVEKGKIKAVRFMLWTGLIHEDENLTEKQVGAMIEVQDLDSLSAKMNETMAGDLPDQKIKEAVANPNE
jgi:hypothetical protein